MAETKVIKCDWCGDVLNAETNYPSNYGLHLQAKDYAVNTSGRVYNVFITPPIDSPKDFCGSECLWKWLNRN